MAMIMMNPKKLEDGDEVVKNKKRSGLLSSCQSGSQIGMASVWETTLTSFVLGPTLSKAHLPKISVH